jgi:hypothetical protein
MKALSIFFKTDYSSLLFISNCCDNKLIRQVTVNKSPIGDSRAVGTLYGVLLKMEKHHAVQRRGSNSSMDDSVSQVMDKDVPFGVVLRRNSNRTLNPGVSDVSGDAVLPTSPGAPKRLYDPTILKKVESSKHEQTESDNVGAYGQHILKRTNSEQVNVVDDGFRTEVSTPGKRPSLTLKFETDSTNTDRDANAEPTTPFGMHLLKRSYSTNTMIRKADDADVKNLYDVPLKPSPRQKSESLDFDLSNSLTDPGQALYDATTLRKSVSPRSKESIVDASKEDTSSTFGKHLLKTRSSSFHAGTSSSVEPIDAADLKLDVPVNKKSLYSQSSLKTALPAVNTNDNEGTNTSDDKSSVFGRHMLRRSSKNLSEGAMDVGDDDEFIDPLESRIAAKDADDAGKTNTTSFGKHMLRASVGISDTTSIPLESPHEAGDVVPSNGDDIDKLRSFGQHILKRTMSGMEEAAASRPSSKRLGDKMPSEDESVGFDKSLRKSTSYSLSLQRLQNLASEVDAEPAVSASFGYHHHTIHSTSKPQMSLNIADTIQTVANSGRMHVVAGTGGSEHIIEDEEAMAFSVHINHTLRDVEMVKGYLPLDSQTGADIFTKNQDGLIILALLNIVNPDAFNMSKVNLKPKNVYQKVENLNIALKAAQKIGCHIVNIGTQDFVDGRQIPILGLFWQIIRILLLCNISIKHYPELVVLLKENETLNEFTKLPSEQILMRWMNYLLRRAGVKCNIASFSSPELKVSSCCFIVILVHYHN